MTLQARYTILSKIADGGTAEIFLATQHGAHGFEKPVVLKRIFPAFYADPQFRNMLVDEAHIAMSLSHSNIVQVLDLGEAEGQYVLALELVDGWTLDAIFRRARAVNTAIPPALALYLTAEICRALAYAHSKTGAGGKPLGIVHRDISPHNVLLSEQGEVKLTDFGIAKAHNRRESSLGNFIKGKIAYMSPEQAAGATLDARSDLFSVGTMLYVMICRRYPFDAPTDLEVLLMVKNGECAPPESARPGLNPEIYRVLKRAMAKAPGDRYQRAEEMLVDVEQVMRVAFRAVGQTELKRWLQDLSVRDGVLPLIRGLSAPPTPPGGRASGDSQPHRVAGTPPAFPPGTAPPPPPRGTSLPTPAALRPIGGSGPTTLRPPPPPAALAVGRKSIPTPPPGALTATSSTGSFQAVPGSPGVLQEPPPKLVAPKAEEGTPIEAQDAPVEATPVLETEEHFEGAPEDLLAVPTKVSTEAAPEVAPETAAAAGSEADWAPPPQPPRRSSSWVAEAVLAAAERAGAPTPPPPGASPPPPPPPLPNLANLSLETPAARPPPEQPPQPRSRRLVIGAAIGLTGLMVLLLLVRGLSGGHREPGRGESATVHPAQLAAAADSSVAAVSEIAPTRPTNPAEPVAAAVNPPGQHSPAGDAPMAVDDAGSAAPAATAQASQSESPGAKGTPDAGASGVLRAPAPIAEETSDTTPDVERSEPAGDADPSTETDGRPRGPRPRIAVLIKSSPSGALVGTAHHSFGPTPVTVRLKIGGNYSFTFTSEGHRPLTKQIHVSGDPDQEVTVTLHRGATGPTPPTTQGANQPSQPAKTRDPNWLQRMFSR